MSEASREEGQGERGRKKKSREVEREREEGRRTGKRGRVVTVG